MASKAKSAASNVFSVLGDTLETAAETFEEATHNSRDSARRAAAATKRALSDGAHKAAYGVSYGVVYAAVFVTELLPKDNIIRRGFVEGAGAAYEARKKAAMARGARKQAAAAKAAEAPKTESGNHVGANHTRKKAKTSPRARSTVKARAERFEAAAGEA